MTEEALGYTYGESAYDGYREATGGKTYDGRNMPAWADLGERIQGAWEMSAWAVIRKSQEGLSV